ncbi:kelch motif domain-containing protein [Sarocladium implicatum]|nr:kelch motif domain-containing protein [Sarocladium implicatum]
MRSRTLLAVVAAASIATAEASKDSYSSPQLVPRQQSDPPPDQFFRRTQAKAVVAGQYLYIVGGQVTYKVNDDTFNRFFVNTTLSLPLDEDWESSDVSYESFPLAKGISHGVWNAGLWVNDEKEDDATPDVYLWGGSYNRPNEPGHPRDRSLWTLQTQENGQGSWNDSSVPNSIKQTAAGSSATCGGKGYMIGGWGSNDTDPAFSSVQNGLINVPGLITYDFKSGDWNNHSIEALTGEKEGTFADGAAVCVEMQGQSPKLFVIGGAVNKEPAGSYSTPSFLDVQFWDPDSEKWYKQETSSALPASRKEHCAVGVPGPNNTYDIFMYGGSNNPSTVNVWVLSLPAFRWFSIELDSDKDSSQRKGQTCVRVGSQMIVVGGIKGDTIQSSDEPDPFPQGLGVLDLNTGRWKSGFSANSPSYEGPRVIRDWYKDHGYNTVNWENDEVASFFSRSSDSDPSGTPTPSGGGGDDDSGSSSTPVGAIAGGVVGGVVGLALIGVAAWYLLRRRRRQRTGDGTGAQYHAAAPGEDPNKTPELPQYGTAQPPVEMEAAHGYSELNLQHERRDEPPSELP